MHCSDTALLIRVHLQVIEVEFREAVAEDSRRSLSIGNRIDAFNHPRCGFGFACEPDFTARAYFSVRQILNLKFQAVPGVGLPRKGHRHGARGFRLPGFEMQHLAVAVKRQHVALRDHAGVALLPALLRGEDIGFDCVVATSRMVQSRRAPDSAAKSLRLFSPAPCCRSASRTANFIVVLTQVGGNALTAIRVEVLAPGQRRKDAHTRRPRDAADRCFHQPALSHSIAAAVNCR